MASAQFIPALLGRSSGYLAKHLGKLVPRIMWTHSKGRALLVTASLPRALRHLMKPLLPADPGAHDLSVGSWHNGERNQDMPACRTTSEAWHREEEQMGEEESFHWQKGRGNSPRHLCLVFSIRQQATGSSVFHFRMCFTCLHCHLFNSKSEVNFLCGLKE